ncbi:MAG: nicotinate-nucleotide adenylyltransferase [Sphingomonas sp.]
MRIGLYGGCFNPVHVGHLAVARGAIAALALDELIFIPSGHPPLKGDDGLAEGTHRVAMLRRAIADDGRMQVSRIELDREGPSYTVDTVRALRGQWPEGAVLFFLLGDDCLERLPRWHGIDDLHALLRFVVARRTSPNGAARDPRLIPLDLPHIAVSSTQVRDMIAVGQRPPATLLPSAVTDYIVAHGLYGSMREPACA